MLQRLTTAVATIFTAIVGSLAYANDPYDAAIRQRTSIRSMRLVLLVDSHRIRPNNNVASERDVKLDRTFEFTLDGPRIRCDRTTTGGQEYRFQGRDVEILSFRNDQALSYGDQNGRNVVIGSKTCNPTRFAFDPRKLAMLLAPIDALYNDRVSLGNLLANPEVERLGETESADGKNRIVTLQRGERTRTTYTFDKSHGFLVSIDSRDIATNGEQSR